MTEERHMGILEFVWENSSVLTEFKERLAAKFPGLESTPQLNRLKSVKAIEALLIDHILRSSDRNAVKRAILKAASSAAI